MTRIFLIRHGEAEGNLYRRIHGVTDTSLTGLGFRQLLPLRERFAGVKIDAVYASDLRRAQQTARALSEPRGLELRICPALHEQNMGAWEDRTWGWAAKYEPEQYEALNKNPENFTVPGGESYSAVLRRYLPALQSIAEAHDGETVALFSHGGAIRMALNHLLGYAPEDIARIPHCDNTSVAELAYENGAFRVLSYNDNSHLPAELSAFSRDTWWKNADFQDGRDLYYLPMDVESEAGQRSYLRRYRETWIASHGSDFGFSDVYLIRAKATAAADPDALVEAFAGGVPCGMLELSPRKGESEGAGHISLLFLEKDYRGRGIGIQLIGQAEAYYRALGRKFLRLCVAETNVAARRFYDRWGFRESGREAGTLGEILVLTREIP